LGGIFEPTILPGELTRNLLPGTQQTTAAQTLTSAIGASFDSFGQNSGVSLFSSTGSVSLMTLDRQYYDTLFTHTTRTVSFTGGASPTNIAPSLSATALTGDIVAASANNNGQITLNPSPTGTLSLIAGGSILGQSINGTAVFTGGVAMADIAA